MERTKQRSSVTQVLLFRKATSKLGLNCRGVLTEFGVQSAGRAFCFMATYSPSQKARQLLAAGAVKQPAYGQNPLAAALTLPLTAKTQLFPLSKTQTWFLQWSSRLKIVSSSQSVCGLRFSLVCVFVC